MIFLGGGANKTEIMFMIFLTSKIVELIFLGSLEAKDLYLPCFRIFYVHVQVSRMNIFKFQ